MSLYATYKHRFIFKHTIVRQAIKFCLVGGTSAVINFVLLYLLTEKLGWWYVYSAAVGFVLSAVFNFTSNKLWTFRNPERGRQVVSQLAKYGLVMGLGLFINTSIIYGLTESAGFDYRLSWVFATGVVTVWNFMFNRFWTFRHPGTNLPE